MKCAQVRGYNYCLHISLFVSSSIQFLFFLLSAKCAFCGFFPPSLFQFFIFFPPSIDDACEEERELPENLNMFGLVIIVMKTYK